MVSSNPELAWLRSLAAIFDEMRLLQKTAHRLRRYSIRVGRIRGHKAPRSHLHSECIASVHCELRDSREGRSSTRGYPISPADYATAVISEIIIFMENVCIYPAF